MKPETRTLRLGQTLIEAAQGAPGFEDWQGTVFATLGLVGFDVAFLKAVPPSGAFVTRGFDAAALSRVQTRWPIYSRELAPLTRASRLDGVAVDREVFGARRDRLAYYQELMRPQGGTASLYAPLTIAGKEVGGLMLGRCGASFVAADLQTIRGLVAPLSVGLGMVLQYERHHSSGLGAGAVITPREGEVLRLLQQGFTNPEIARALGTSPNTVRNQVSSLLDKLGATTRAELVGLTVRS